MPLDQFVAKPFQISRRDMNGNPRILPRESIDSDQYGAGRHRLAGSDPQFPRRRIGKELNVLDALSQLVEDRDAAFDERAAIRRWLDAARAAIEQAYAEGVFQLGNRSRQGGLGRPQAFG